MQYGMDTREGDDAVHDVVTHACGRVLDDGCMSDDVADSVTRELQFVSSVHPSAQKEGVHDSVVGAIRRAVVCV
jgi:hypothetical protein